MSNLVLIDLVNRFRNCDESSFEPIYIKFIGLIKHFSYKSYGEDMEQDLMLFLIKLLQSINLSRFSADESTGLERYISVAIKNEYILKSKAHQSKNSKKEVITDVSVIRKDNMYEILFIKEVLGKLSPQQRRTVIYKYIYNYSDIEIAAMLKISRQAVNRLKRRGMESLRRYYNGYS